MKRNDGYLTIAIAAGLLMATLAGLGIASYKITAVSGVEINPYEKNQQSMQKV